MRMKCRTILFLLAETAALFTTAQSTSELLISPQTNEIIAPAPSSATQIRYQSPQPSLATGAIDLSVPLYTLEVEGLSIPFILNYHTSGIKPLDDPYPNGYGWTMLPALKIVRTIRGRADELFAYRGDTLSDEVSMPDPKLVYACMVNSSPHLSYYSDEFGDRYDAEKDIFTISLPSGTYNRVFQRDENREISFLGGGTDDEIAVTADDDLHNFYVRDAHGFIYHFGDKNVEIPRCAPHFDMSIPTSWGIIDITLPSGRKIQFDWTKYYPAEKIIVGGDTHNDLFDPISGSDYGPAESDKTKEEALLSLFQSTIGTYKTRISLSSVSFPGGTISISYNGNMVSNFKVASTAGTIKTVTMRYGDGNVESLFLKELEISGEGTYKFDYDPQRFEGKSIYNRQDWWGYYNGKSPKGGEGYICLSPYLEFKAYYNSGAGTIYTKKRAIGHADKSVDETAMQAGILKKIVYPTGGYSTFEYETHRFHPTKEDSNNNLYGQTDPQLDKGGGLRVKRICTYSNENETRPHIRSYEYDSVKVTAVPSAATFVTVNNAIGICNTYEGLEARHYRQVFVGAFSDYMQNHIGEEAIWYSQVTERFDEGKIIHRFGYSSMMSSETRSWGRLSPDCLRNVFTHGILPFEKEVYKKENNTYNKIETTEYEYETVYKEPIINTHIRRDIVNTAGDEYVVPDFVNGTWFANKTSTPSGDVLSQYSRINFYDNGFLSGEYPYDLKCYTIELQSERLKSKTVTQHLENGDYSQTETYQYKSGTSIISSVEITNPADTRTERIDIVYPSELGSEVEKGMVAANIIAEPLKTTYTFGADSVSVRREMERIGVNGSHVFRPKKEWQARGVYEWLVGNYKYDSYGNLREYVGMDSVPSTYLWGYSAKHPVYRIDGARYTEIRSLNSAGSFSNGSAEQCELSVPTNKDNRWLVTKALWKPLVGISSLRQPCGLTTKYDYDTAGRLGCSSIDGCGPMNAYSYHINENGLNYMQHTVYMSVNEYSLRDVVNYDGLGRELSRLTALPNLTDNDNFGGYSAILTEYDKMDRPFRTWAPVNTYGMHPDTTDIKTAAFNLYGTEHAYGTTFYEASPMAQIIATRKAGEEWNAADRRVKIRHLVNEASGDYSCPDCYVPSASSHFIYTENRHYPAGALLVEEITDEENKIKMTFIDRRGKIVMIREGVPGDWNDTRYLYNNYGDLLFVIQPQDRGNVMKTKCFRYSYNSRGNCIMKAVPGGAVTRYCYDSRNRLFAEQDGNMKDSAQWLIHHYDYLGRPAFNAFAKVSDAVVQALSTKSFTVISPVTSADMRTHTGGYVCPTELTSKVTYIGLDAAHYYDSYDFASGFPAGWDWSNPPNGFATPRTSVLGLETAMAAGRHILLKMYDNEGRIIREVFGEMLQVPEREVLTRYNYQGQIAEQLETTYSPQTVCRSTVNTYSNTGHLLSTKVSQDGKTAILKRQYDGAGRLSNLCMGGITDCSYSYNANGWLTLSTTKTKHIVPVNPLSLEPVIELPQSGLSIPSDTVITERLYYADSTYSISPRYDGKISARKRDRMITVYDYDNHGRLASSQSISTARLAIAQLPDFSTTYTYDRNANITSLTRQGIIDRTIRQINEYGLHSSYTMSYNGNRLCSMHVDREGEDYEGRTGPGVTGYISDFWHDSNGNLCRDSSRGIVLIKYNRHNLPADIYFENGHRQTINYDGFGQKRSIVYKQTSEPILGSAGTIIDVPTDSNYTIEGRRDYIGSHVFVNDSLEYSAFPGGYFAPEGTFYYVTDWQGNNAAVLKSDGTLVQQTTYYPYGEPTIEPFGQRYLFGGKEREHAGGNNSYDFGARWLTSYGSWSTVDKMAEIFNQISPYSYCGGDPINWVDRDGNWSIKVSASKNRELNPYAILSAYDRHLNIVYQTVVMVKGNERDRGIKNADTPQGRYKLLEWRKTNNKRYEALKFGPDFLLATHYEGGEGGNRDRMHIHGGRDQGPELTPTRGCVRISNEDIVELREITDLLEKNNKDERMEYMEVVDDLEFPVHYSDRQKIKDLPIYGGELLEFIVITFKNWLE